MSRLILVSNRLPITVEKKKGEIIFRPSVGGLATGLETCFKSRKSIWLGWSGIPANDLNSQERKIVQSKLKKKFNYYDILLTREEVQKYYLGFCNKTLWPLFHYFTECVDYDETLWNAYKLVNKQFCDAVTEIVKPGDTIWIHDYHLMLLPGLLRENFPRIPIGFFLHIPFPSFEIFRLLPRRREILEALLGADLIGFHTYDYVRHFLSSVRRLLGYEHTQGLISAGPRIVKADTFPMGIDFARYSSAAQNPDVSREIGRIKKKIGHRKIILSVDRLDYTKGIVQRLEAFDEFLTRYPEFREKVTLILITAPSRTGVDTYMQIKRQVDELVGRINGRHAIIGWIPVWYLYYSQPFHILSAFYNLADVALITPLRDGMNLIAKEFIAAKNDCKGVLILSEMAGVASEMGEAMMVNPNNVDDVVEALKMALTMPEELQIERNKTMRKRLRRYDIKKWFGDFMDRLSQVKAYQKRFLERKITGGIWTRIVENYRKSRSRLLLLDYDGTLVSFASVPEKAQPDKKLLNILYRLGAESLNELVIISGRDKETLQKWFGGLRAGLIAEHGIWFREKDQAWETLMELRNDWKESIRPILDLYTDRTPGALWEEKDYSLAWHYRQADPDLAAVRVAELKDALLYLTEKINIDVREGNKIVEVQCAGINKGTAALRWLRKRSWDFILAIGDDLTDEDMFAVMPETSNTIRVGLIPSLAKYNVESVQTVRKLLFQIGG